MPLIFHFLESAASSDTYTVSCRALVGKGSWNGESTGQAFDDWLGGAISDIRFPEQQGDILTSSELLYSLQLYAKAFP